ncbi:MAG: hypothetical protein GQ477_01975 [Nanohaloarchaea archaeon]|nr:hypothetical protein [Candidatus Nanohaloarchaea archaeon]
MIDIKKRVFKKTRKGQFFVISIVVILFSLTVLNGTLTQNRDIELSYMQYDRTLFVINQMESDIFNIISVVGHKSIIDDIEEYLVEERSVLAKAGYTLEFEKGVSYIGDYPNNISINYTIKSSTVNIRREMKTNAWCVRYDYNDFCEFVNLATNNLLTKESCCLDFNVCC